MTNDSETSETEEVPRPPHRSLPSERYAPGQPGPVGFIAYPTDLHILRSKEVLTEVAQAVSRPMADLKPLHICLTHFRHDPLLSRSLFGFTVHDVGTEGEIIYPLNDDAEVRYAVVLNLPVELQRESALAYMLELIYRQVMLEGMRKSETPSYRIDTQAALLADGAKRELIDRLRYGWRPAAELVARRGHEAGFSLRVRYEPDVFPTRDAIVRRLPRLRQIYNTISIARDAIDKTVSMIGGTEPVVYGNVQSAVRDWTQQRTALLHTRHYFNQAIRDAEVCGNGYVAFTTSEPVAVYNLRPEEVIIKAPGVFALDRAGQVRPFKDPVAHFRGIDQLTSLYGISLLEALMPNLSEIKVFDDAQTFARQLLNMEERPEKATRWAQETLAQADRVKERQTKTFESLLFFSKNYLPQPKLELYFPGQDTM